MDEHAKQLIWGFVVLVVIWFFVGGPQREIARQGFFIHPLAPIDSGTGYGGKYLSAPTTTKTKLVLPESSIDVKKIEQEITDFTKQAKAIQTEHDISYLSKDLIIDSKGGALATNQNKEYIRIVASVKNVSNKVISDLILKSGVTGLSAVIPQGKSLPIVGQVSENSPISLLPGGRAIITTGESPIGSSFEINTCSGYLGQFQEYTPALRQECPYPTDELKSVLPSYDSTCIDFVANIPRCGAYTGVIPSSLSNSCRAFITRDLTYNGCVAIHKNDKGFFSGEWRLFLSKQSEMWRNSQEIIKLIDAKGNTLDAITY